MYIKEETKINKFKEVRIPTLGEYFHSGRFQTIPQEYGGENPVNMTGSRDKAELAEDLLKYDKQMQEEANNEQ